MTHASVSTSVWSVLDSGSTTVVTGLQEGPRGPVGWLFVVPLLLPLDHVPHRVLQEVVPRPLLPEQRRHAEGVVVAETPTEAAVPVSPFTQVLVQVGVVDVPKLSSQDTSPPSVERYPADGPFQPPPLGHRGPPRSTPGVVVLKYGYFCL